MSSINGLNGSLTNGFRTAKGEEVLQVPSSDVAALSEQLLRCQSCGNCYTEPCLLNCFHTLCAKCVRKVTVKGAPGTPSAPAGAAGGASQTAERPVVICPICK